MTNATYIKRHLTVDGQVIHQDEMKLSGCVVILAEPGAGKTKLLEKIAESLNTARIRANVFRNRPNVPEGEVLILDGLDEVAKIDYSAIDSIFAKARHLNPSLVVFACRASEWVAPRYKGLIKDYFGVEPTTYHLVAFNEAEQRTFFQSMVPDYSFDAFYAQASSVDLSPLFGNPLFLRLFALAYVDSPHAFESKKRVFEDAVIKLVKEHAEELPSISRPNIEFLTNCAEEIFAKLLLSGSEGFSSVESHADHKFPFLYDLMSTVDRSQLKYLMDTGLFKLADSPSLHEPIHRVVAEYCAASYLAKRINNNQDLFSLKRCLAIIAPNGVARHELRGLMGWLAALGNKNTQELVIALDPYAAIANGDPAQLHSSSKIELINALSDLAETDPYFRAELRQAIHLYALGSLSDSDEIHRLGSHFNGWLGHAGLFFRDNDFENIIRFSFEHENLNLWIAYFQYGHGIETPQQLKDKILEQLPAELHGKIDLFVLDLSRPNGAVKPVRKRRTTKKK